MDVVFANILVFVIRRDKQIFSSLFPLDSCACMLGKSIGIYDKSVTLTTWIGILNWKAIHVLA